MICRPKDKQWSVDQIDKQWSVDQIDKQW
jgi:hypothetical protein